MHASLQNASAHHSHLPRSAHCVCHRVARHGTLPIANHRSSPTFTRCVSADGIPFVERADQAGGAGDGGSERSPLVTAQANYKAASSHDSDSRLLRVRSGNFWRSRTSAPVAMSACLLSCQLALLPNSCGDERFVFLHIFAWSFYISCLRGLIAMVLCLPGRSLC
jgi:hypothetical protein